MAGRLIESLATTDAFAELFSDASVLQAMLDFEVGLARAQAKVGLVPRAAADAIAAVAKPELFDAAKLAKDALLAGALADPAGKSVDRKRARERLRRGRIRSLGRHQSGRGRHRIDPPAKTCTPSSGIRSRPSGKQFAAARRGPREYRDAGAHSVASRATDDVRTQGRGMARLDSPLQSEAQVCI